MSSNPPQSVSLRRLLVKHCVLGVVLVAVLWSVSGHADWLRAWCYVAFTLGFQAVAGILLYRANPDLLVERSRIQKGTKPWDRVLAPVVVVFGPLALWCTAAWDVRAHWPPPVPAPASAAAFVVCGAGVLIALRAMLANPFFSGTVRIQSDRGQKVVDRGPYRHVRHPGYAGALLYSLASPVALGSWLALYAGGFIAVAFVVRTALEDRTLRAELPGYAEYASRVRKRLVPGLW